MKTPTLILLSLAMFSLANYSSATTLFWDGGTGNIGTNGDGISQGGAGTWGTTIQNWDQGVGAAHVAWDNSQNYDAYFGAVGVAKGAGLVTLNAAITANSLTVVTTNYVLTDGGVAINSLTVSSITNTAWLIVSNNIVNSTTFLKDGSSTVTLDGASTGFTGAITINNGILQMGDSAGNNGPTGFGNVSISTNATLGLNNNINTTYGQTISGQGSVAITGKSAATVTTLTGANTYTNETIISAATLSISSIDDVNPNPIGTGPLQIGNAASGTVFLYAFPGGDVTTSRPLIFGGNGNAIIKNTSSGVLTLAGPVSYAANVTTANKTIFLDGNMPSVFASSIPNNITATTTNLVNLTKQGTGTWLLTGSNSFSGGVFFPGGSANGVLLITNDAGFGAATGNITFTTNGSGAGSFGEIGSTNFPVTLAATRKVTFTGPNAGGMPTANFYTTDTNRLTVASYITGGGNVSRASSSLVLGAVCFDNDTNDYTGKFSMGFGVVEFTSVANGGLPSALGAASSAYAIGNGSSGANFKYIGAGNRSATRTIDWQGSIGGLILDASGGGTVQYLATGNLKSGLGSSGLTLQGTNTGNNTLAQVINDSGGTTTLTKAGSGTWVLTGANTYSGTTTISGGALAVSSDVNLGTAPASATSNNLIINGGTLAASASFTLNANRGIALGPTGTNSSGANAVGNGTIEVAGGQTLIYGGIMADNTATNTGGLIKSGAGTLTLSGVETYTGNTTISAGTLALSGSGSIATSSDIIMASGVTLDVSGVGGGYTLAAIQALFATNGAAVTISGSLNCGSASLVMTNLVNTPTITKTNGTLTLNSGNAFTVNLNNGGAPLGAGSYKLVAKGVGGAVAGTAPTSITVGGDGLIAGATAALSISNNELYMVVSGGTLYPPVINSFDTGGGGVVLSFSGTNGQSWKILSSTNVATPLSNWNAVATGTFTGNTLNFTNSSPVEPQRFYIITSP